MNARVANVSARLHDPERQREKLGLLRRCRVYQAWSKELRMKEISSINLQEVPERLTLREATSALSVN
jgi:hypothetical protein